MSLRLSEIRNRGRLSPLGRGSVERMTEHEAGTGRRSGRRQAGPGGAGSASGERVGHLEPLGDQLPEPDIAPEHDSLTVDDGPIDKPAESDARWA
jgi:hypothetical protein